MKERTRIFSDKVFTNYQELLDGLTTLGDPLPGYKRVFRGQTKDYGKMLPSGLRGRPNRSRALWGVYSLMVAADILRRSGKLEQETDQEMLRFGIQAISQHYGPGSEYLDVTHSVEIALWFALHVSYEIRGGELVKERFSNWPSGGYEYEFERVTWIKYSSWKESEGLLYVFDVPEWMGTDVYLVPRHGELVDLLKSAIPDVLKQSKRIQVQQACLIIGDPKVKGGDLSDFFVCEPIRVKWPMEGAPGLSRHVEEMFPFPSDDPWYGQFLSVPFIDHVNPETKRIITDCPLAVSVYWSDDVQKLGEITRCFKTVRPTLETYSGLENLSKVYETDFGWLFTNDQAGSPIPQLNEATKILLEGPIIATTLPVKMGLWNHESLLSEMSESVASFDLETNQQLSSVSLNNLFVEFSPMEHVGWQDAAEMWKKQELPSSLWFVRNRFRIFMLFFYQAWPKTDLQIGPHFLYEFDTQQKRFYLCFPEEGKKAKASGIAWSDQAFFTTLCILRNLSPTRKVNLVGVFPRGDGSWDIAIKIRNGESIRLMHPANPDKNWYVLRDLKSNEPYMEYSAIAPLTGQSPEQQPRPVDEKTKVGVEPLFDIVFRSKLSWPELGLPSICHHSSLRAIYAYRLRRALRSLTHTLPSVGREELSR